MHARGVTPRPRSGAAAESTRLQRGRNSLEELPKSEVKGGGQKELPLIRGQGRRPRGATLRPRSVAAGRRHPASEVQGQWPRRATLRQRPGVVAERCYPASDVSGGREETPSVQGQGQWQGGATPCPRPGAARRRHPASEARGSGPEEPPCARGQGWWPGGATREGLEELSHVEGQERWW